MADPTRWLELTVRAPLELRELVADAFAGAPFTAVELRGDGVRTFAPDAVGAAPLERLARDRLDTLARGSGLFAPGDVAIEVRLLPPADFATAWRAGLRALRIGRVCILPDEAATLRAGDVPLRLLPGGSFGTGRHASTRYALRALQRFLASRPGARVLDAGTGSGILAVAAVLLGARAAAGIDVDPNAQASATALATQNGVADRCTFVTADLDALQDGGAFERPFDGVLANLYLDLVERHAKTLAGCLRPSGFVVVAGIRRREEERARRALAGAGIRVLATGGNSKWVGFSGVR